MPGGAGLGSSPPDEPMPMSVSPPPAVTTHTPYLCQLTPQAPKPAPSQPPEWHECRCTSVPLPATEARARHGTGAAWRRGLVSALRAHVGGNEEVSAVSREATL